MKKLSFMIGSWEGDGWIEYIPGQRRTFRGAETVESKLGGVVLLIEGIHKTEDVPMHHALAILSYDPEIGQYRFQSHLANGRNGTFEAMLIKEGTLLWEMPTAQGTFRYTATLTDDGQWHEVGEMSQDGQTWRQFFEMTLARVADGRS